jgi:hypothetical protein
MSILQGMWGRYDGTRRNPFNPIECGDHYIRNAAGWSVLEALTGFRHNAVTRTISFAPLDLARSQNTWQFPFTTNTGWGTATYSSGALTVTCEAGHLDLAAVHVDGTAHKVNGQVIPGTPLKLAV